MIRSPLNTFLCLGPLLALGTAMWLAAARARGASGGGVARGMVGWGVLVVASFLAFQFRGVLGPAAGQAQGRAHTGPRNGVAAGMPLLQDRGRVVSWDGRVFRLERGARQVREEDGLGRMVALWKADLAQPACMGLEEFEAGVRMVDVLYVADASGQVRVYDLRGQLLRGFTLGPLAAGARRVRGEGPSEAAGAGDGGVGRPELIPARLRIDDSGLVHVGWQAPGGRHRGARATSVHDQTGTVVAWWRQSEGPPGRRAPCRGGVRGLVSSLARAKLGARPYGSEAALLSAGTEFWNGGGGKALLRSGRLGEAVIAAGLARFLGPGVARWIAVVGWTLVAVWAVLLVRRRYPGGAAALVALALLGSQAFTRDWTMGSPAFLGCLVLLAGLSVLEAGAFGWRLMAVAVVGTALSFPVGLAVCAGGVVAAASAGRGRGPGPTGWGWVGERVMTAAPFVAIGAVAGLALAWSLRERGWVSDAGPGMGRGLFALAFLPWNALVLSGFARGGHFGGTLGVFLLLAAPVALFVKRWTPGLRAGGVAVLALALAWGLSAQQAQEATYLVLAGGIWAAGVLDGLRGEEEWRSARRAMISLWVIAALGGFAVIGRGLLEAPLQPRSAVVADRIAASAPEGNALFVFDAGAYQTKGGRCLALDDVREPSELAAQWRKEGIGVIVWNCGEEQKALRAARTVGSEWYLPERARRWENVAQARRELVERGKMRLVEFRGGVAVYRVGSR